MNAFSDRNGWYRLDAVAAITPHVMYKSQQHVHGKAPEIDKTVAVLHLAGGSTVVTDTDINTVIGMFEGSGSAPATTEGN